MFFLFDLIDIESYADVNTSYTIRREEFEFESKLEITQVKLFIWFYEKGMKVNQDKCHFLSSLDITTKLLLPDCSIDNSSSEKVLGVVIDRKVNFDRHVANLCNKASDKIQA